MSIEPTDFIDKKHQLTIIAKCVCSCGCELVFSTLTTKRPKKGEEYPPYKITCNCKELNDILTRIGNGKKVEITLPTLMKRDFSIMKIEKLVNRQAVESLFKDQTENVIPCPTGNGWNYLRVFRPKVDRRGNNTGETIVEYYCYKFDGLPTFDLTVGKKVYRHLLPEIIEKILNDGEVPKFVIKALKMGEIPVLEDNKW